MLNLAVRFKNLTNKTLSEILQLLYSIFLQTFASSILRETRFNDVWIHRLSNFLYQNSWRYELWK